MKITAGDYKFRNIEIPRNVRPTTEKVREAICSMIRDRIPDAVVLDLFAGSGSMGLELLSIGAGKCYFNEVNRQNFRILQSNINNCNAGEKAVLSNKDYLTCISGISETLDIVFMDPPYSQIEYYEKTMEMLQEKSLLDEGSVVIAEHLYDNELSECYGNLVRIKAKKYGTIGVDIFILEEDTDEESV